MTRRLAIDSLTCDRLLVCTTHTHTIQQQEWKSHPCGSSGREHLRGEFSLRVLVVFSRLREGIGLQQMRRDVRTASLIAALALCVIVLTAVVLLSTAAHVEPVTVDPSRIRSPAAASMFRRVSSQSDHPPGADTVTTRKKEFQGEESVVKDASSSSHFTRGDRVGTEDGVPPRRRTTAPFTEQPRHTWRAVGRIFTAASKGNGTFRKDEPHAPPHVGASRMVFPLRHHPGIAILHNVCVTTEGRNKQIVFFSGPGGREEAVPTTRNAGIVSALKGWQLRHRASSSGAFIGDRSIRTGGDDPRGSLLVEDTVFFVPEPHGRNPAHAFMDAFFLFAHAARHFVQPANVTTGDHRLHRNLRLAFDASQRQGADSRGGACFRILVDRSHPWTNLSNALAGFGRKVDHRTHARGRSPLRALSWNQGFVAAMMGLVDESNAVDSDRYDGDGQHPSQAGRDGGGAVCPIPIPDSHGVLSVEPWSGDHTEANPPLICLRELVLVGSSRDGCVDDGGCGDGERGISRSPERDATLEWIRQRGIAFAESAVPYSGDASGRPAAARTTGGQAVTATCITSRSSKLRIGVYLREDMASGVQRRIVGAASFVTCLRRSITGNDFDAGGLGDTREVSNGAGSASAGSVVVNGAPFALLDGAVHQTSLSSWTQPRRNRAGRSHLSAGHIHTAGAATTSGSSSSAGIVALSLVRWSERVRMPQSALRSSHRAPRADGKEARSVEIDLVRIVRMPRSFAEQVALFAQMDILIAAVGAANTNALWMRDTATVVVLAPCSMGYISWMSRTQLPRQFVVTFKACKRKQDNVTFGKPPGGGIEIPCDVWSKWKGGRLKLSLVRAIAWAVDQLDANVEIKTPR